MSAITELTQETFEPLVRSGKTLIVDFWAPWCGPCKGFAPVFEKTADDYPDVQFAKINTDQEQELAGALGIRSIPTLMVFRENVLLFSQPGALSGSQLKTLLDKVQGLDMPTIHAEIEAAKTEGDAAPQAPNA